MGDDGLSAVVVDASHISRDLGRLAIGRDLIANLPSDARQHATRTARRMRSG
jgi:hypothetical protein